jgi:succinoglycan biosynthesis transport protein ExoP
VLNPYDPADPSASPSAGAHELARPSTRHALGPHDADATFPREGTEGAQALRETLGMLYRAKWTLLAIFAGICVVALPVIWTQVKPKYRATAVVRVAPENVTILREVDDVGINQWYPLYVATQIINITNNTVLQSALERDDVKATTWYGETPKTLKTMLGASPPNHLERLKSAIEVEQEGMTDQLAIQVTTTNAADTHILANAVLEEYMAYTRHETNELETLRFKTLREEHAKEVANIQRLVERRGELSKQLGTNDPDIVRAQLSEDLGKLEMERKKLFREYELLRWDLRRREASAHAAEAARDPESTTAVVDISGGSRYSADAEWRRLDEAVREARQELEEAALRYGENHPRMKELRSRLTQKQRAVAQREQHLGPGFNAGTATAVPNGGNGGQPGAAVFLDYESLKLRAARMKRDLDTLDSDISKLRAEQQSKGELAKQVAQITDELTRSQNHEEELHNRIQSLETEQKAPGRITVAAPALPVSEAHKDKRLLLSLMTMAGALFCGLVFVQLRVSMNPKVFAANDVQSSARVPFLGQLPHSEHAGTLLNDPNLLLQECMRMVRTALLERMNDGRQRAVMITSASSSAGKTTVAIELAKSLAHLGKRTLLVEADLRRPTLAKRIGLNNEDGLCALLTGDIDDEAAITPFGRGQSRRDLRRSPPAGAQPRDSGQRGVRRGAAALEEAL